MAEDVLAAESEEEVEAEEDEEDEAAVDSTDKPDGSSKSDSMDEEDAQVYGLLICVAVWKFPLTLTFCLLRASRTSRPRPSTLSEEWLYACALCRVF